MPRFFTDAAPKDGRFLLTGDDAHHISYSLRMAVGDEITVCDASAREYLCRLTAMDGQTVTASVIEETDTGTESPVEIRLFQGYPKADKMEFIIQKAVELGASVITPFESERCVKRPKAEKQAHIAERQNKIAEEAAKQCGRRRVPRVDGVISFADALAQVKEYPLALFCYEGAGTEDVKKICGEFPEVRKIAVFVGCEGGFSPAEAEAARAAGCRLTGLGPRILRCETAPLFALSALCCLYEM